MTKYILHAHKEDASQYRYGDWESSPDITHFVATDDHDELMKVLMTLASDMSRVESWDTEPLVLRFFIDGEEITVNTPEDIGDYRVAMEAVETQKKEREAEAAAFALKQKKEYDARKEAKERETLSILAKKYYDLDLDDEA